MVEQESRALRIIHAFGYLKKLYEAMLIVPESTFCTSTCSIPVPWHETEASVNEVDTSATANLRSHIPSPPTFKFIKRKITVSQTILQIILSTIYHYLTSSLYTLRASTRFVMSATPAAPPPVSPLARYRLLSPSAAVKVSPLCLGTMNFGTAWSVAMFWR